MIIAGDVALGKQLVNLNIPDSLSREKWLVNLEGSLVQNGDLYVGQPGVYNDFGAINILKDKINLIACSLANNHLLDMVGVSDTLKGLRALGLKSVGAGLNLKEAQKPLCIVDTDGTEYNILSFGWDNIQCQYASGEIEGVNPYTENNVKSSVIEALKEKEGQIICFFHWDYELEKFPLPFDRRLSMELIDMGVDAVIGCHSHRIQPIEFYKGKPIVYGLGNFLFQQGTFFGGNLNFPKFCEYEYAFEITKVGYRLHHFLFDKQSDRLNYVKSEIISENTDFDAKALFSEYSNIEYDNFFKANRTQKKLIPIFYSKESKMCYWLKSKFIKIRGFFIDVLTKLNIKSYNRDKK